MEKKDIITITVVVFLGILAATLGFICEVLRIKETDVIFTSPYDCEYPRGPALGLGITAAVSLTISQILLTVSTRSCLCCKRGPHQSISTEPFALLCFILSWFTCIIALILFVTGAALNQRTLNESHSDDKELIVNYYCYIANPGVFTGASILSLITVLLDFFYIRKLNPAKNMMDNDRAAPNQVSNIAMGQPQIPTVIQDPVFVHEDTYIRRQLAE